MTVEFKKQITLTKIQNGLYIRLIRIALLLKLKRYEQPSLCCEATDWMNSVTPRLQSPTFSQGALATRRVISPTCCGDISRRHHCSVFLCYRIWRNQSVFYTTLSITQYKASGTRCVGVFPTPGSFTVKQVGTLEFNSMWALSTQI